MGRGPEVLRAKKGTWDYLHKSLKLGGQNRKEGMEPQMGERRNTDRRAEMGYPSQGWPNPSCPSCLSAPQVNHAYCRTALKTSTKERLSPQNPILKRESVLNILEHTHPGLFCMYM